MIYVQNYIPNEFIHIFNGQSNQKSNENTSFTRTNKFIVYIRAKWSTVFTYIQTQSIGDIMYSISI